MITIKYGAGNSLQRDINGYVNVGAILEDSNLQGALGFGANVEATIDGVYVASDHVVSDGDTVMLVTRANRKG